MVLLLILLALLLMLLFYQFFIKPQLYWKTKNVKQGPPIPLFGDFLKSTFWKESMIDMTRRVYSQYPEERYSGIYQTVIPTLILRDPELIKQITVKDFDSFVDHITSGLNDLEPVFSKSLLFLTGQKWREMRAILSPAFTGTRMRLMFQLMDASARQYVDYYLGQNKKLIREELKGSFTKFANDVIANCAFGVTVDSLKDPGNQFFAHSRALTDNNGIRAMIVGFLLLIMPKVAGKLGLSIFPKDTIAFFRNLLKDSVKLRKEQNIVRPDMINLLIEAQNGRLGADESDLTSNKDRKATLTEEEMVAQVLLFFFAGFETVSNAASFLCYELALHPEIQNKLRLEIDDALQDHDKLTYDVLNKLKYLEMCLSETLRKHPPVPFIDRVCTKSFTIQPTTTKERPLVLSPGEVCWLPIAGLHNDEKYFEKPANFDPERFSDENKAKIDPYTYIPFGSGPRNCIGSRFALMEVKTLLFHVLSKFELVVIDKTRIPLKYDRVIKNPAIEGGCWIGFKRRE